MDSFQPIAENILYQKTTCLAQQNVSANGIVQFIINPGTYNVDQTEIQFPIEYSNQAPVVGVPVAAFVGEQRYMQNCDQLIVYWDGKLVYNSQKPFITQKKFYDAFCTQKQNITTWIAEQKEAIPQFKDLLTRAVANTRAVSILNGVSYIAYPIRQFLPFLFRKDQQTFDVQQTMNIQVRINFLNVPIRSATNAGVADIADCTLSTSDAPSIQLMKLQNISIPDKVRSAYFQNIYVQNQINSAINIDVGSKMLLPAATGYSYTDIQCSARQPDAINTNIDPASEINYTTINQIDGVQIIQGKNTIDASSQYKYLQKDQILPYLTSCVLYHNILGGGIHNFNIQQFGTMSQTKECLVIGYQMYVGA